MGKGAGWIVAIGGRLSVALLATAVLVVAVMLGIAIYVVLFDPRWGTIVAGFVALVAAVAGVLHIVRNHHRVRKNLVLLLLVLLIVFVGLAIASPSKYEIDTVYAWLKFWRLFSPRDPTWAS